MMETSSKTKIIVSVKLMTKYSSNSLQRACNWRNESNIFRFSISVETRRGRWIDSVVFVSDKWITLKNHVLPKMKHHANKAKNYAHGKRKHNSETLIRRCVEVSFLGKSQKV